MFERFKPKKEDDPEDRRKEALERAQNELRGDILKRTNRSEKARSEELKDNKEKTGN